MAASTPANLTVDVAVVGGGIAGASLAASLARAGLGVTIVERERRFRDRVRGEALHPWGAAEADRLGLVPLLRAAGGRPLPVWQRYADRAPIDPYLWSDDLPHGLVEWAIPHPSLQETLLAHAASCGARLVRPARVISYRRVAGRAEIDIAAADDLRTVCARIVVGADGGHSPARRWLGAATKRDPVHHMIGGGLLDGVSLDASSTHQAYPPGGMVVIFPQGDGRARAYVVCDPARAATYRGSAAVADFIAACATPLPEGAFALAVAAGPVAFFPAVDVWPDRLTSDRLVLIGDAAGVNDPSQGHGLSLAFRDARELRDLLLDDADWSRAISMFAARRAAYAAVLRAHARWAGLLTVDQGPAADARRERVARARDADPTAGGFAGLYAFGPDGLVPDERARQHFFGEDLPLPALATR